MKSAPTLVILIAMFFLTRGQAFGISLARLIGGSFDDGGYELNFLIPNHTKLSIITS